MKKKIKKEEFRDALLEAGAKSLASANGLTTRIYGKKDEITEEDLLDVYKNSKSKFKTKILKHFDLKEEEETEEEKAERQMLKLMLEGIDAPKFDRKLGENDYELIVRYAIEVEAKKEKMAKFVAAKAVNEKTNIVKHNSKYFAVCCANK